MPRGDHVIRRYAESALSTTSTTATARYTEWCDWKTGKELGTEFYNHIRYISELTSRFNESANSSALKNPAPRCTNSSCPTFRHRNAERLARNAADREERPPWQSAAQENNRENFLHYFHINIRNIGKLRIDGFRYWLQPIGISQVEVVMRALARLIFVLLLLSSQAAGQEVIVPQLPATKETQESAEKGPSVGKAGLAKSDVEKIVADYLRKKADEKKLEDERKAAEKKADDEAKKQEAQDKKFNETYGGTRYDLYSLYDGLFRPSESAKKWYDKLSIRGYSQLRYARTLASDGAAANLLGDRSVNGSRENFSIRRARLILFGDVSEHLALYFQTDFTNTPQGATTSTFFAQLRDIYADVYLTTDKVHRIRAGLSKVPYGFENMQSSQNRVTLDRTDAMNSGVAPNERDLGLFYYWTPVDQQKIFKALVDGGLKGSGNYGVFGFGVYDGQGGSTLEANNNLHIVSRLTYPFQLPNSQVVELGIQGLIGKYVVNGAAIRPQGRGAAITPGNTGGNDGILDERIAATFVWYPQPFGIQAEWQAGRGPGLNQAQTQVDVRNLNGGYILGMYRHETPNLGIFTPYARYQMYNGGYRSQTNAPYGHQRQVDLGVEWQIRKEMELTLEYSFAKTPNFTSTSVAGQQSYRDFTGQILRLQFQVNY